MIDYDAALDVQFDVVEAVGQEALIPEVVLDEDAEEDLRTPINLSRTKTGGQHEIHDLLKGLFDNITTLETKLAHDKEDRDVQASLGKARTIYDFSSRYSDETASKQEGITADELAALVAATT